MLPSEIGATHGSRIKSRTAHLPRKSLRSASARIFANTNTITFETMAKMKVFFRARWKV